MPQFYLDGYVPGDPLISAPHPAAAHRPETLPEEADVVIVGCGPAGLVLAAQLANFPELTTVVIDRSEGPLQVGRADGVACRTVEIFETLGLAGRLIDEGYWVNEVCFWQPDTENPQNITRTGRVRDTEEGISEFPHVIVNQARMLAYLRDQMERSPRRLRPYYGLSASAVTVSTDDAVEYPVELTLKHIENREETGATSTIHAKYVVGCDGARSGLRAALGLELIGDPMNVTWGVMDALTVTDFPDIRMKVTVHSADAGSMLIIPREGGYLDRFYIELDHAKHGEALATGGVTPEMLTETANRILHPYSIDVKSVGWWSVYEIGQRLCSRFDDVPEAELGTRLPRVFIAGDACHTHSAKAGQGMNVSMSDAFNLGWKLATVLSGTAKPELLATYTQERQRIAQGLIDFDLEFARMFSARPKGVDDTDESGIDPETFHQYFVDQGRFTAGVATRYEPSMLTGEANSQELAAGFGVGMRLHSAPVVRLADARSVQLGHVHRADGAWRLYIFADRPAPDAPDSRAGALCEYLASADSPLARYTPAGADPDAVIDVIGVFQQGYRELFVDRMPPVLLPHKGTFGLIDFEKIFCADASDDIFETRSVNRDAGCMVLVRPDQYVADVLALDAYESLSAFLEPILIDVAHPAPTGEARTLALHGGPEHSNR